jgi:hypothetical protein
MSGEAGGMTMKPMKRRAIKWGIGFLVLLAVSATYTAISWTGPPQGVTATVIGRATYGRFKVKTPAD